MSQQLASDLTIQQQPSTESKDINTQGERGPEQLDQSTKPTMEKPIGGSPKVSSKERSKTTAGSKQTATKAPQLLPASEVPCRYFIAGYCTRGYKCPFKHDLKEFKIKSIKLKLVSPLEEVKPSADVTLPREHMVPGGSKAAIVKWRSDYLSAKAAEEKLSERKRLEEEELRKKQRNKKKVQKDLERILAKQDKVGEPARKLEKLAKERKVIMTESKDGMSIQVHSDPVI